MKRVRAVTIALLISNGVLVEPSLADQPGVRITIQNVLETFREDYVFPGDRPGRRPVPGQTAPPERTGVPPESLPHRSEDSPGRAP